MRTCLLVVLCLLVQSGEIFAQVSGNIAYSQSYAAGKLRPDQNEREKRLLTPGEIPGATRCFWTPAC